MCTHVSLGNQARARVAEAAYQNKENYGVRARVRVILEIVEEEKAIRIQEP